jgi:hypothetical protein
MTEQDIIRAKLISDTLIMTKYFFKVRFKRKFVENAHHRIICNALNDVLEGKIKKLAIAIAPRYGKTELAVKTFIASGLAINPSSKFIHLSYSQSLALDNSEECRDFIQEQEYKDLFPYVKMDKSSTAKNKWYTSEGGGVYATATGGQITGFGAGEVDEEYDDEAEEIDSFLSGDHSHILPMDMERYRFAGAIIIDDALKPDDAESETKREKVNQRFETTIRSRTNSRNTPIIVIGQRLHESDLIGYLMTNEPDEWTLIELPCIQTNEHGEETALWEFKQTLDELKKIREADENVFETQYQQNPKSPKGKLLPLESLRFENLDNIPEEDIVFKFACGDPADKGGDHYSFPMMHVCITDGQLGCFVKDVIHSKEGIEVITERYIMKSRLLHIEQSFLEANGVGLAAYLLLKKDVSNHSEVKPFTSTIPKEVRILSNYEFVKKYFVFDENYKSNPEYKLFIDHVIKYEREGENKNKKDAIDGLCSAASILKIKYKQFLYA